MEIPVSQLTCPIIRMPNIVDFSLYLLNNEQKKIIYKTNSRY
jgi:hypothetical protein